MGVKSIAQGNVLVSHWFDELTVQDIEQVFALASRLAKESGPVSGINILGPVMKRPSVTVFNRMMALHPQMRQYHRSIHYVILLNGFLASSVMSNVTRMLTNGTGGSLRFSNSVTDALTLAAEYHELKSSPQSILAELQKQSIPVAKS